MDINTPKISVIVPVYNVEKVLHYCVESILNQKFSDFELILVDDGSPDNSGRICDEYVKKDTRVKVIHKNNGGVSSARNAGIEAALGEYLCFVDSDDYLESNYLKELIETKKKYPDFDNTWCYFRIGNKYDFVDENENEELPKVEYYSVREIMTLHEKWLDAGPVCKLYSREVIINNNLKFDKNLSLGEDLTFNFNYLDCTNGNILVINRFLYNYVQLSDDSLSKKYYPDMFDIYKKLNQMMWYYINKWNCDEEQIKKYYNACFYKYEVVLKNTFSEYNTQNKKSKYKLNNSILKSDEFKKAFNNSNCFIHPLYRVAYKSCKYRCVQFVDKLVGIKNN